MHAGELLAGLYFFAIAVVLDNAGMMSFAHLSRAGKQSDVVQH